MSLNKRILFLCQDDLETIPYHRVFAMIEYLRERVDWIDVLYYDRSFDREGLSSGEKLKEGLHNFFHKPRFQIKTDRNVTYYGIRRLPVDGILSTWSQDPWVYRQFRKINKMKYDVCISEAPGPARIARWLRNKGIAKYFIYDDTDYFPGFAAGLRAQAITRQEKIGVRSADKVICVGEKLAELRTRQGAKNVKVVPNGVDLKTYTLSPAANPHAPAIIYVGSVEEWAGINLALEAMPQILQKIPNLQFQIIGDGSALKGLVSLATKLNIQKAVSFLGKKLPGEVPAYLSQADIAIITPVPSKLWEYACPLKLFQFMACGLPVISTDVGELALLVKKYQVGFSIPFNSSIFANKVIELIGNPALKNNFSKNGVESAVHFDWQILLENYWKTITEVMDANRD